MAPFAVPLLALPATLAWPVWVLGGLVVLGGALWFSQRNSRPDAADGSGASNPDARAAEDAIRIRELQETVDELNRLRAAAIEASQRRDEFLTTISHELRSPLNAILGWTQVLEPRGDIPDDVRDALRVIRRNALRQRQLLDDLVDMSRVVSGALRIEPRPMRVQDALDEACQAVRPEMERKGIRLDCGSGTDAVVSGDARRLQQVLRNLLANAIRFTPSGGAVSIRTAVVGPDVSIAITDTGMGIDPAFLPHVFEPFRQQAGDTPRDQSTFGLGLALARIIVVGHGGRVLAHSDGPGRGATFTVMLPALAMEQGTGAAATGDAPDAARSPTLSGVRILAVDDEPDWRELLGHILGAAGAEARIAGSAAEAIQIFESWRPDVVLTDIAMPVTDGYGLLSSIRGRGGAGRAVPAIAMTAHAGAQERNRSARAGFAEHLAKPIPPHDLVEAVRRVIDQSPRARGVGSV
jgi:signal transduction histidine kinase/ActR/RegA family two-component response regulator